MSTASERLRDAIFKRIDQQCNALLEASLKVTPHSSEATSMEKLALMMMSRNAAIEAYKVAKGIVEEEYGKANDPKKPAEAAPERHAPYGRRRHDPNKEVKLNG